MQLSGLIGKFKDLVSSDRGPEENNTASHTQKARENTGKDERKIIILSGRKKIHIGCNSVHISFFIS